MRINDRGSSSSTRSRYVPTEGVIAKTIQGGIADALGDSSYVLSVVKLVFLMLIPKN